MNNDEQTYISMNMLIFMMLMFDGNNNNNIKYQNKYIKNGNNKIKGRIVKISINDGKISGFKK